MVCFNSEDCSTLKVKSSSSIWCKALIIFSISARLAVVTAFLIRLSGNCIFLTFLSTPFAFNVLLECPYFNRTVTPKSPAVNLSTAVLCFPSATNNCVKRSVSPLSAFTNSSPAFNSPESTLK